MKTPKILSKFSVRPISHIGLAWFCLQCLCFISARANVLSWTGSSGTTSFWNDSGNWGFVGTPGNGDTVIFPGGVSRLSNTNNIANLTLAQIRFVGPAGSYTLYGNAITLTNSLNCTNASGTHTIFFSITNSAPGSPTNVTIDVGSGVGLNIFGTIYGSAAVTKTDAGALTYDASDDNYYTGATFVNAGILYLDVGGFSAFGGPLVIGDGSGAGSPTVRDLDYSEINSSLPITVNLNGLLDLNGNFETINPALGLNGGMIQTGAGGLLTFGNGTVVTETGSSAITGNLNVGSTTCTFSNGGYFSISASISGTATLIDTGSGTLTFTGVNTFTNVMLVQQGFFYADGPYTLGSTNSAIVVSNNASLLMEGTAYGITNKTVVLYGVAPESDYGALDSESNPGTNYWAGPVVLEAATTFDPYYSGTALHISGPISGPGFVTVGVVDSAGQLFYDGTAANTYAGPTTVAVDTTLLLSGAYGITSLPGNVDIFGTLRMLSSEQFALTADVAVETNALLDFGGQFEDFNTLHGTGSVTFGNFGYLRIGGQNGTSTFGGVISGIGYPNGYTIGKFGTGTFTMTANNTYSNQTYVFGGTVLVDGSQIQSPVIVESGGTIGGTGMVGGITNNNGGEVDPGNLGPGQLQCGDASFASGSYFNVNVDGPRPTTDYSLLYARGTATLTGTILNIDQELDQSMAVGDVLDIIDSAGPVVGTFSGFPGGSTITLGGITYQIAYYANSVALTVISVPGQLSGSSVSGGNGNHHIDPNECNDLYLSVSNFFESPMNGVTAILSSDTPHVVVTQPNSAYPNITPGTAATNLTPFQITTLPDFPCASNINLTLSVYSSLSDFDIPIVLPTGSPGTPVEFDNSSLATIPMNPGVVTSTNMVSGISSPIQKVTVALYLYYPFDASLTNIFLISPDGTTVSLSAANGGSGAGYGSSCYASGHSTVFDDAAATSITAGTAPFVGTFQPQQPLAAFIGKSGTNVNGGWKLQIGNGFSGSSSGTLFCWSLFISPTDCSGGGGVCDTCYGMISGSITNTNMLNSSTGRLIRDFDSLPTCQEPAACPGSEPEDVYYDAWTFTNKGPETCVTIYLEDACGTLDAAAYLAPYDTNDLCQNYLGDMQSDVTSGQFTVSVPANTNFVVVVFDVPDDGPGCDYTLLVTGGGCPEKLKIAPTQPNSARLFWSSSAGGYLLQSTPNLTNANWMAVTNQPIVTGLNYNVTNSLVSTNKFYRLYKP